MDAKKRSFYVWLANLILIGLIVLVILLSKWFGVSFLGNTTLLKVAKFANRFDDYISSETGALKIAAAFIYITLVITAICGFETLRSLRKARTNGEPVINSIYIQANVLSVLVILVVIIANIVMNTEMNEWYEDIFELTAAPFFVLAFGIAGCYICNNYSIQQFDFSDIGINAFTLNVPSGGKAELYCPTCKETVPAGNKFCAVCGTELVSLARYCPYCGKPVAHGSAFCTNCGHALPSAEANNQS